MKKLILLAVVLIGIVLVQGCVMETERRCVARRDKVVFDYNNATSWDKLPSLQRILESSQCSILENVTGLREFIETVDSRRRQMYVDSHPNLSEITRRCILEGIGDIGMTRDEVRASIGWPNSVNRTVGTWGVHEQWIYSGRYLYFENGILTSWQN